MKCLNSVNRKDGVLQGGIYIYLRRVLGEVADIDRKAIDIHI